MLTKCLVGTTLLHFINEELVTKRFKYLAYNGARLQTQETSDSRASKLHHLLHWGVILYRGEAQGPWFGI